MLQDRRTQTLPVNSTHPYRTRHAVYTYASGTGSAAKPNLGDCLSYAAAKELESRCYLKAAISRQLMWEWPEGGYLWPVFRSGCS